MTFPLSNEDYKHLNEIEQMFKNTRGLNFNNEEYGGTQTLFLTFRPMIYFKKEEYNTVVGEENIHITDIAPEIAKEDVTVYVNGRKTEVLSLQKIYEASLEGLYLPMYMVQIPRELYADCLDKQTIVLEYDTKDRGNGRACSRGFTQFFYKDGFCTR